MPSGNRPQTESASVCVRVCVCALPRLASLVDICQVYTVQCEVAVQHSLTASTKCFSVLLMSNVRCRICF